MKRYTRLTKMNFEPLSREQAFDLLLKDGKVYAPVDKVFMRIRCEKRLLCPLTGTEYIDGEQVPGTFASALVLGQILVCRDDRRKGLATNAIQWLMEIAASLSCSFVRIISPELKRIAEECGFSEAYPGVYDYVV